MSQKHYLYFNKNTSLFCVFALFFSYIATARWENFEESNYATKLDAEYKIKEDGTYSITATSDYHIQREEGKKIANLQRQYNTRTTSYSVKKAHTIQNGKHFPIDKKQMEDKAVASNVAGFDQLNQVTINYPHVSIGSILHLNEHTQVNKTAFPHFTRRFYFNQALLKGSQTILRSKKRLFYKLNSNNTDIKKKLHISYVIDKKTNEHVLTFKVNDNLYYSPTNEPYAYWVESIPFLEISTASSMQDLFKGYAQKYQNVYNQKLPKAFKQMADGFDKKKPMLSEVTSLITKIIKHIRYKGDWRTIEGAYVPRSLVDISHTQYGDCKDYSASLIAILRSLGYDAYPAFVLRQMYNVPTLSDIHVDLFNHAIVYLNYKGNSYWLDPTNNISYTHSPLPDIAGRQAFVLKPNNELLDMIPGIKTDQNAYKITEDLTFLENNVLHKKEKKIYTNIAAFNIANKYLPLSKKEVAERIIREAADDKSIITVTDASLSKFFEEDPSITGPITKTSNITYFDKPVKTTVGSGYLLSNFLSFLDFDTTPYECCGMNLTTPEHIEIQTIIRNKTALKFNDQEINRSIDNPWIFFSRHVKQTGNDIVITYKYQQKVTFISNSDLKSLSFQKFQEDIRDHFTSMILIFK